MELLKYNFKLRYQSLEQEDFQSFRFLNLGFNFISQFISFH